MITEEDEALIDLKFAVNKATRLRRNKLKHPSGLADKAYYAAREAAAEAAHLFLNARRAPERGSIVDETC